MKNYDDNFVPYKKKSAKSPPSKAKQKYEFQPCVFEYEGKRELDPATRTLPTFWLGDRIHRRAVRLDGNESEKRVPMTVYELIRRGREEAIAYEKGELGIEDTREEM